MKRLPMIASILTLACTTALRAVDPAPATTSPADEPVMVAIEGGYIRVYHADGSGVCGFPREQAATVATVYIHYLGKIVTLTDDQKQAITDLIVVQAEAVDDFYKTSEKKRQSAEKALDDAKNDPNPDQDAIDRAKEEIDKAWAPLWKINKDFSDLFDRVFTRQQKHKIWDAECLYYIAEITAPVKLMPSQIRELQATYRDRKEGVPEAEDLRQAVDHVLSPEQKFTIAKYSLMDMTKAWLAARKLTLTPEQLKKVKQICDEAAARNPDEWDWIKQLVPFQKEIKPQVVALLTDDQRAILHPPAQTAPAPAPQAPAHAGK